jgi:hypothetical protein
VLNQVRNGKTTDKSCFICAKAQAKGKEIAKNSKK